jgi:hypothetical protein
MLRKAVGVVSRKGSVVGVSKLNKTSQTRRWQSTAAKKAKIYVIYYSTYGHVYKVRCKILHSTVLN